MCSKCCHGRFSTQPKLLPYKKNVFILPKPILSVSSMLNKQKTRWNSIPSFIAYKPIVCRNEHFYNLSFVGLNHDMPSVTMETECAFGMITMGSLAMACVRERPVEWDDWPWRAYVCLLWNGGPVYIHYSSHEIASLLYCS